MDRTILSWGDVHVLGERVLTDCVYPRFCAGGKERSVLRAYPIPNGGIPATLALQVSSYGLGKGIGLTNHPELADFFMDDIVDSGATRVKYLQEFPDTPFFSLIDKTANQDKKWIEFPWESLKNESGPQENIRRILEYIGEDPHREGLLDTPDRVVRSYSELFSGYRKKPEDVLKIFLDGACDEMVVLRDVNFTSMCEHHMLAFHGVASIAYIPNGRIIGVSKLARILEIYARRLQVQERLTEQVTSALDDHLQPKGSACVLEATHFCMMCRGVQKHNAKMITSSLTGVFRDKPEARAEFLAMIGRR